MSVTRDVARLLALVILSQLRLSSTPDEVFLFIFSPKHDNSLELDDDKFPCRFFPRSAPFTAQESSVQVTHINGMKYRINFSPHCASAVLKGHKLHV
jgi:hypothetical protein